MKRAALLAALVVAGCGDAAEVANGSADSNQIERLSTPKVEKADPRVSARLQPLSRDDLGQQGLAGPLCQFRERGQVLLVSAGSDAIVRIGDEARHLIHSAPVDIGGGFFEDRQVSVSVGTTREGAQARGNAGTVPARLRVTNRRTEAEVEYSGEWGCTP